MTPVFKKWTQQFNRFVRTQYFVSDLDSRIFDFSRFSKAMSLLFAKHHARLKSFQMSRFESFSANGGPRPLFENEPAASEQNKILTANNGRQSENDESATKSLFDAKNGVAIKPAVGNTSDIFESRRTSVRDQSGSNNKISFRTFKQIKAKLVPKKVFTSEFIESVVTARTESLSKVMPFPLVS